MTAEERAAYVIVPRPAADSDALADERVRDCRKQIAAEIRAAVEQAVERERERCATIAENAADCYGTRDGLQIAAAIREGSQ